MRDSRLSDQSLLFSRSWAFLVMSHHLAIFWLTLFDSHGPTSHNHEVRFREHVHPLAGRKAIFLRPDSLPPGRGSRVGKIHHLRIFKDVILPTIFGVREELSRLFESIHSR